MGSTLTRKQVLQSAAQRIGNAVAHRAIYADGFGIREAREYERQAKIVIAQRGWNDEEIARFREIAIRRAKKEIAKRAKEEHLLYLGALTEETIRKIDKFIEKELRR